MSANERRRASPGYTYEACQGCGVEPEYQRTKGTLCRDCRTLLDTAIRTKADQARRGELVTLSVPTRSGDLPYLDEFDVHVGDFADRGQFGKALHALMVSVSEKVAADDRWGGGGSLLFEMERYDSARRSFELRAMPRSVADALRELFVQAKAMVGRAHEDGKARGQSLLVQLARGDITADAFNKNAARIGGAP